PGREPYYLVFALHALPQGRGATGHRGICQAGPRARPKPGADGVGLRHQPAVRYQQHHRRHLHGAAGRERRQSGRGAVGRGAGRDRGHPHVPAQSLPLERPPRLPWLPAAPYLEGGGRERPHALRGGVLWRVIGRLSANGTEPRKAMCSKSSPSTWTTATSRSSMPTAASKLSIWKAGSCWRRCRRLRRKTGAGRWIWLRKTCRIWKTTRWRTCEKATIT